MKILGAIFKVLFKTSLACILIFTKIGEIVLKTINDDIDNNLKDK